MLVKYYLSDNIKASFEGFALGLQNAWAGPTQIKIPPFSKSLNPKKKPNPQTHKEASNKKRNFWP